MQSTRTTLVTGHSGTLGTAVVALLGGADGQTRTMSRHSGSHRGDLSTGEGVDDALTGVDVIIHCAAGKHHDTETRLLVERAKDAGVSHIVFVSIAGIEEIPLGYYRRKLAAERAVESSGIGFSTFRTVQFHPLISSIFEAQRFLPVIFAPAASFQPIDPDDVATRLVELASGPAMGRVTPLGGPEIRTTGSLARAYLTHHGSRRRVLSPRIPGATFTAIRAGHNLVPDHRSSGRTFEEYLAQHEG